MFSPIHHWYLSLCLLLFILIIPFICITSTKQISLYMAPNSNCVVHINIHIHIDISVPILCQKWAYPWVHMFCTILYQKWVEGSFFFWRGRKWNFLQHKKSIKIRTVWIYSNKKIRIAIKDIWNKLTNWINKVRLCHWPSWHIWHTCRHTHV